jgi:hypothetical protein
MQEEFPRQASAGEWVDSVSRRSFLKVMGASFALAGLAGCTKQPDEPIFPYVKQPEDLVLGRPMYFATAHPFPTGAIPVLVKSEAFRPIKLEGNPEHPASKGRSDAFTQGSLLDLYDPDRSQHPRFRGEQADFGDFQQQFSSRRRQDRDRRRRLLPLRDHHLAHARRPVEAGAGEVSAGQARAVRAGEQ